MSILTDIDNEKFKIVTELLEEKYFDDLLLNFIISSKSNITLKSQQLLDPKHYGTLKEIIFSINKNDAINKLKQYLTKEWYKNHKAMAWYDSHKKPFDVYSGYWSWESGAIAKILHLDDTSLKGIPYYPYDMVQE